MAFAKTGKEGEVVFEFTPEPGPDERPAAAEAWGGSGSAAEPQMPGGARRRSEYEAFGSGGLRGFELPEQRLARLSAEVADLLRLAEGSACQGAAAAAEPWHGGDPAAVAAELRVLEQRLGGLARDAAEAAAAPGARGAAASSLAAQLERLAGGGAATEGGGPWPNGDGRVTYELSYVPTGSAVAESSKVAALESSVAGIEQRLGIFEECPFADLQTAVVHLQRRLSVLDSQKLEAVRSGVHKMTGDVEAVLQKKQELEAVGAADPELDRKAGELYELCHRWSAVAPSLPAIISRLQSLQALHQESASFTTRLAALEHQQDDLARLLEATNAAVQELGRGMQENMSIMRDSVRSLEENISKAVRA